MVSLSSSLAPLWASDVAARAARDGAIVRTLIATSQAESATAGESCVTGSVTVGSDRDDGDGAGRVPIVAGYVGRRASLGGKSRISRISEIGFQDHRHRPLGHPSA